MIICTWIEILVITLLLILIYQLIKLILLFGLLFIIWLFGIVIHWFYFVWFTFVDHFDADFFLIVKCFILNYLLLFFIQFVIKVLLEFIFWVFKNLFILFSILNLIRFHMIALLLIYLIFKLIDRLVIWTFTVTNLNWFLLLWFHRTIFFQWWLVFTMIVCFNILFFHYILFWFELLLLLRLLLAHIISLDFVIWEDIFFYFVYRQRFAIWTYFHFLYLVEWHTLKHL